MSHHELSQAPDAVELSRAAELAAELELVFVATSDADGNAHLELAEPLSSAGDELVVRAFFDRTTVANLRNNPRLTVLAWDPVDAHGFQLSGTLVKAHETAMLDGCAPLLDRGMPQIEYELRVQLEVVSPLGRQPHRETTH
ncbi:MAG TPA: pyridoxamine 5'-phosphate oxidase family protein [Kofleriaceae bacterium]|nr:pyridoxamine 5'-phosphate oxidase family protein [Kofleriaceae bacterium]